MAKRSHTGLMLLLGFIGLVAATCLGGYIWFLQMLKPVNPQSTETQVFVIKKGQGISAISANLEAVNLIRSRYAFRAKVALSGPNTQLQAGTFRLNATMDADKIIEELTHGTIDTWVTILEGWRREEIAAAIKLAFAEKGIDFNDKTFLKATEGKEGRLFPDTYLFPLNAKEETIASILETTFNKKITSDMTAEIKKSGRTLDQVLTLASLVEREARGEEDRKIVAGILWKRLANDWPLQVDATLQYAFGYDKVEQTWWRPPTGADKEVKSPFNTYAHPGLPPGPICSPSLSSITAAIYPTESPYWFYLTDANGRMRYAETIEQHNRNIDTYLR